MRSYSILHDGLSTFHKAMDEGERQVYHVVFYRKSSGSGDGIRGVTFYDRDDFECFMEYALPVIRERQPEIARVSVTLNDKSITKDGKGNWKR